MNTQAKHSISFETSSGVEVVLKGYNLDNLLAYAEAMDQD